MKAAVLITPSPISQSPLQIEDVPTPSPRPGNVLLRVLACGVCRTDLHIVEGEVPARNPRIIPGHQIVGEVIAGDFEAATNRVGRTLLSDQSEGLPLGSRFGVSWFGGSAGTCTFCRPHTRSRGELRRCAGR